MLRELSIQNVALIEESSVTFDAGLNVISGETGAGKSMVLHALELILGAKPKPQLVRQGSEFLKVEALFEIDGYPSGVLDELPDVAKDALEAGELVLSRTISTSGKSKVYVNGRLASVSILEEIAQRLVNLCGQAHHVRLLDPRYHLSVVDDFAENSELFTRYSSVYAKWKEASKALHLLETEESKSDARRVELEFLVKELEEIKIAPGLRSSLEDEIKRLSSGERMIQTITRLVQGLSGDGGALATLRSCTVDMQELERWSKEGTKFSEVFHQAVLDLRELGADLERYGAALELDEERLQTLRDTLAEVARLERKYKRDDEGLCELLDASRKELATLGNPRHKKVLEAEVRRLTDELTALAASLRESRVDAGKRLAQIVQKELAELSMPHARLSLELTEQEFGPNGTERGELLLASNKGEALKPLRQIASGGELSRITLVLKKILRDASGVNVLVFDEVDTGISGKVARAVGEKLKALAGKTQVLCITHLPQVASLADLHLLVEKNVQGERTVSSVRPLVLEERVEEIARMLSGATLTEAARQSARELLNLPLRAA